MMPSTRPPKVRAPKDAGLTLFELLVVLIIIGILGTIVGPRVIGYVGRSRTDVAAAQLGSIQTSLELYYLDVGRYPTTEQGLTALIAAPEDVPTWRGPYFGQESGLTDPWGRPYLYQMNAETGRVTIGTLGRDGVEGGSDESADIFRN
ncbi:type II secretion system major pseudopilin GspG [Maricaulis sp.]|uniref:type II secretion system major pseudopilin GspG n=1 Tax=Maricaulis sp. TaxID=1486257 RepID=UPI002B270383|nr:type II secretion system major pseudopilin GspG [Maricaulis sp.]